jgi:hypothetical protein
LVNNLHVPLQVVSVLIFLLGIRTDRDFIGRAFCFQGERNLLCAQAGDKNETPHQGSRQPPANAFAQGTRDIHGSETGNSTRKRFDLPSEFAKMPPGKL